MARVVHFEIQADDPQRAISFYQKALGWEFYQWEGAQGYWLIKTGPDDVPGIDGGLAGRETPRNNEQAILAYVCTVDVSSLDETSALILEHGGTVAHPKHAVGGIGWLAYFKDTEGNTFGVMQRDSSATS